MKSAVKILFILLFFGVASSCVKEGDVCYRFEIFNGTDKPMTMNLRADDTFVEDEGWHKAATRYNDFLRTRKNQKILFLELGVGFNTPGIIKYPFWQMTIQNTKAIYACLNYGDAAAPGEIEKQSICTLPYILPVQRITVHFQFAQIIPLF